MSSRPRKRSKPNVDLVPGGVSSVVSLLGKLSKDGLAQSALGWIKQGVTPIRLTQDPEVDDEDEDGELDLDALFDEYSALRDAKAVSKAELAKRIQQDWAGGFSHSQLAVLDVQALKEKPNSKSWTAYQLMQDTPHPAYASPKQLTTAVGRLIADYHPLHAHLAANADSTIIRLQLLPPPPATLPTAILVIHLTETPFILLPSSVSPSFLPILLQSLCAAASSPPAREARQLQLSGKDWTGLARMLRENMASGGMAKWAKGRGEGGGPLVPKGRRRVVDDGQGAEYVEREAAQDILEDEPEPRRERQKEAGTVFGREELPVLEKLDYEVSVAYPTPPEGDTNDDRPPPFLLRFEGSHVLNGLRHAVDSGFADSGLASWIGEVAKEGRNVLQVDENGPRR